MDKGGRAIHKTIESQRGKVHYYIYYNDDPEAKSIVFIHGLGANHKLFEKQLKEFKKEYNIITWDLPLHGLSRPYEEFSFRNSALELKSILDYEGIKRVILVGMSMGGFVSQEFYYLYPEIVTAFIGIDTAPLDKKYYSSLDLKFIERLKFNNKLIPDSIKKSMMVKLVTNSEAGYDYMRGVLDSLDMDEIYEQIEMADKSLIKEGKEVNFTCPVLLIVGKEDYFGKIRAYNKAWAADNGYPLVFIKNAGHLSNIDNFKEVNSVISNFIKEEIQ